MGALPTAVDAAAPGSMDVRVGGVDLDGRTGLSAVAADGADVGAPLQLVEVRGIPTSPMFDGTPTPKRINLNEHTATTFM